MMPTDARRNDSGSSPEAVAPPDVVDRAREVSLRATSPERYSSVAKYFAIDSNYAGALFLGVEPNAPDRFTPTDLFAVSSLSVNIPARGARRLLQEAHDEHDSTKKLKDLTTTRLEDAKDADLEVMADFHHSVKKTLRRHGAKSSNAWVTAAKLCARKRPHLFPVRDRRVSEFLGFHTGMTLVEEYAVYRSLMNDHEVRRALEHLEEELRGREIQDGLILEGVPLRLLDAALWMLGE